MAIIVVANKSGQLANQLFLFAHLIAFAAEHNMAVANLSFDNYCKHFEIIDRDLFCRFPARKSILAPTEKRRNWIEKKADLWSSKFIRRRRFVPKGMRFIEIKFSHFCYMNEPKFQNTLRNKYAVVLRGWRYRDLAAFDKHSNTIRHFFQPKASVKNNVDTLIQACRNKAEVIVGIHIRRGDYEKFRGGRYFYEPYQYAVLMNQMETLFPHQKLIFLICSNEVIPQHEFANFQYCLGNNHIAEDLYSFAMCDYIIGPPSTYTQWASFYGQVPLYRIFDPSRALSLSAFEIADGNCDLPEDIESFPVWD